MSEFREITWKIDAYSAETMPLERLLDYLRELAVMLGEGQNLHLIRVESSSTRPVFSVRAEVAPRIQARALEVRTGIAPREALQSYRKINKMLREDKTKAVLCEAGAEIIPFPGVEEELPAPITGIHERGSIDGKLIHIGGRRAWVPLQFETLDEIPITGLYAKQQVAKQIAGHLFEPLRVHGKGRWSRTPEGDWNLDHFAVTDFEKLSGDSLPRVVATLRSVRAPWPPDPLADLEAIRHGDDEVH